MHHHADPSEHRPPTDGLASLARVGRQKFEDCYGRAPEWVAAAPGRVNLIGEHTDYNDGFVLPMAIGRHVVMAAAPAVSDEPRLRVRSTAVSSSLDIPLSSELRPGEPSWANYVRGVVSGFIERGLRIPSLDAILVSDVPLGGGLSSSAALEMATATLLEAAVGTRLGAVEKARLCQRAEHEFAGVPCGLMDQLASMLGDEAGLLLIDCRSSTATLVPLADDSVAVLIVNTHVRHALGDGEYALRRADCAQASQLLGVESLRDVTLPEVEAARERLGPRLFRRARHVVSENHRTLAAAHALRAGDYRQAGALMFESHRSLRDDYEVSCTELDLLVELADRAGHEGGVFGSRMTGGGFGGCTVTLARTDRIESLMQVWAPEYTSRTGREPSHFVTRPARGAHLVG